MKRKSLVILACIKIQRCAMVHCIKFYEMYFRKGLHCSLSYSHASIPSRKFLYPVGLRNLFICMFRIIQLRTIFCCIKFCNIARKNISFLPMKFHPNDGSHTHFLSHFELGHLFGIWGTRRCTLDGRTFKMIFCYLQIMLGRHQLTVAHPRANDVQRKFLRQLRLPAAT